MATKLSNNTVMGNQQELANQVDNLQNWITTTFLASVVSGIVSAIAPGTLTDATIDDIVSKIKVSLDSTPGVRPTA